MRTNRKIYSILCLLIILSTVSVAMFINMKTSNNDVGDGSIQLLPPAFVHSAYAQGDDSSFLLDEAGISAYVNVGSEIDISRIESLFRTVEDQTEDYIVGSMIAPGYEDISEFQEIMDIHVYIHRDGWIVAYLLEWQNIAVLIDWAGYDADQLNATSLDDTIRRVATILGKSDSTISYYDFSYPEATNLLMVADRLDSRATDGYDSFTIKIPPTFIIYESSWYHATYDGNDSVFSINDDRVNIHGDCGDCWRIRYGTIEATSLAINSINSVSITTDSHLRANNGAIYGGLILIYGGTE